MVAISSTTALVVMAAAAAAATAYSAYAQGQAQSNMSKYNAQVADLNAQQARAEGEAAADQAHREGLRRSGAAQAALSASGVDLEGSPLSVMEDVTNENALNEQVARYNGLKAQSFYRNQAGGDLFNASQASSMGTINAGASLLGGAAKAYGYSLGGPGSATPANDFGPIAAPSSGLGAFRARA